jgi:hypothetical protein
MGINSVTANSVLAAMRVVAPQYRSTSKMQMENPVFRSDSLTLGCLSSPYQTYTAMPTASQNENWCISDHYSISPSEVKPLNDALMQAIADSDFSGMTDIEIYGEIENMYAEVFGKDFMMAFNLGVPDPDSSPSAIHGGYSYVYIGTYFQSALNRQLGETAAGRPAHIGINRERQYGNMTDKEIKDAIRAKYPPNADLTYRDLQLMSSELRSVGVLDIGMGYGDYIYTKFNADNIPDGYAQWLMLTKALDKRADLSIIFGVLNNYTRLGRCEPFEFEYKAFFVDYLGATLDPDGLLQVIRNGV